VRAATRRGHEHIEGTASMRRLLDDDYTELEYVAHISRLLGFYAPLEMALAQAEAGEHAPPFANRTRLLIADLADLGLTPLQIEGLPRCRELPLLTTGNCLGGRYVCEGASLGGQIISRQLRTSLGAQRRFAFYHEDAVRTGLQWKAFCTYLETRESVWHEAVCTSAVAVFDAFGQWFAT
jgi:heme oxygenase